MKNKFFTIFVFLIPLGMSLSSCSDFRKAVGKEKVIPDEFSVAMTPSLIVHSSMPVALQIAFARV